MKNSNPTQDEIDTLFLKFRKEDVTFEDLVSERDKIMRIIEIHSITIDALKTQLTKWDDDVSIAFNKLLGKKFRNFKKSEENKKMTDINKLKENKKIALEELDKAMNACSPEQIERIQNEEKVKKEFLSLWKDYKSNKIEKEKFLQISDEFAKVFYEEKEMRKRFGKIIGPLHKKYEKICELLNDLERVNNG